LNFDFNYEFVRSNISYLFSVNIDVSSFSGGREEFKHNR
jgi:hypothetical protein